MTRTITAEIRKAFAGCYLKVRATDGTITVTLPRSASSIGAGEQIASWIAAAIGRTVELAGQREYSRNGSFIQFTYTTA